MKSKNDLRTILQLQTSLKDLKKGDRSNDLDNKVKSIVDTCVKKFLKHKSDIIQCAYRTKTSLDDLHYSIVLKNDSTDNRDVVFTFLDSYDLLEISEKYPLYFQFVPAELIDKIHVKEKLELEA